MKFERVYDNGGECLGDLYVDLSELQKDSVMAILHIAYMDKAMLVTDRVIKDHNTARVAQDEVEEECD